jgi:hypothetical protein
LHTEELYNLYSFAIPVYNWNDKIKEDVIGKTCSTHGEKRNAYSVLVGKSEGKRLLGRIRPRWEDNIKMDLRGTGWRGMDWIYPA